MCTNGNRSTCNDNTTTHSFYNINHYLDTISGHVILTTVCDGGDANYRISVSTLELKD